MLIVSFFSYMCLSIILLLSRYHSLSTDICARNLPGFDAAADRSWLPGADHCGLSPIWSGYTILILNAAQNAN